MLDLYAKIRNSLGGLNSALRIAISNANNFNSPGYKYTFSSFSTVFNEVISAGTETTNPMVLGGSMTLGSTSTDFSQGNLGFGTGMDVAIVGNGFFVLSKTADISTGSNSRVYTRAGRFQVDFNNKFVTDAFGRKVYGFELNAAGEAISTSTVPLESKGHTDIGFTDDGVLVANFQARKDAIANGEDTVPNHIPLYKLAVTSFPNRQGLVVTDGSAYATTAASGEALTLTTSGQNGLGEVKAERLESSNIDIAKVALDINLLNRGYNAIQGVIDDVNKTIQNTISKLGG